MFSGNKSWNSGKKQKVPFNLVDYQAGESKRYINTWRPITGHF